MNKLATIGLLLGLILGVLLLILSPSLLDFSYSLESVSRSSQNLSSYSYKSGSTLAASVLTIPIICSILGGIIGFVGAKLIRK